MNISNFIECSNRVESPRALFDALVLAATDIGFDQVAYGALNYIETIHLADLPKPAVALNYPIEWQKRYFERKYSFPLLQQIVCWLNGDCPWLQIVAGLNLMTT